MPLAAQTPALSKVVIFTAGIDPFQYNPAACPPVDSSAGCYDAYARAAYTFSPMLAALGCESSPPAGSPFVLCPGTSIGWIPYSYAGIVAGAPAPYTGAQTGQPLATSAALMQALVALIRSRPESANAAVVVVGHSLGGATATYWGADHPETPIITLDSPVNGIWPLDPPTLNVYCNASVGLLTTTQQVACNQLVGAAGATSPAVLEVRTAAAIAQMGSANALNFANTLDAFVPSWFAVNRASRQGAVLKTESCYWQVDPIFNHFCIMTAAAADVAAFVKTGVYPPRTPIRPSITLTIVGTRGGLPIEGSVVARRLGVEIARAATSGGRATLSVPWLDVAVDFTYDGGVMSLGALPGAMSDLMLVFSPWTTPPTKHCTPANPAIGGTTSCEIALTSGISPRNTIQDTITSPARGRIVACEGGFYLGCGVPTGKSVLVTCRFGCPTGASFTVRITSPDAGAPAESLVLTPNEGAAPVLTFLVTPSPMVSFGGGTGSDGGVVQQLAALKAALSGVGPGDSLATLVARARQQVEAGRPLVACGLLGGFDAQVRAYGRGGLITSMQAQQFTADAGRIRALLGCR